MAAARESRREVFWVCMRFVPPWGLFGDAHRPVEIREGDLALEDARLPQRDERIPPLVPGGVGGPRDPLDRGRHIGSRDRLVEEERGLLDDRDAQAVLRP